MNTGLGTGWDFLCYGYICASLLGVGVFLYVEPYLGAVAVCLLLEDYALSHVGAGDGTRRCIWAYILVGGTWMRISWGRE